VSRIEGSSLLSLINPEEQDTYQPHPGYLETEVDVLCDANKLYGLRTDTAKFIYNQAHRREETPIGLSTRIPLKGPSVVLLRIQGDPSIRLMTHIRYRTEETYTSNDPQHLAHLNTTVVHGVSWGTDPLHREIEEQTSFLKTPEGWRLQATPDIYSIAYRYGKSNGWPTDWMVLEGVGVDASIPAKQQEAQFHVDQIELYAPGLRYPDSPRFRKPFWVIEDFEDIVKPGLVDSNQGPLHSISSTWRTEKLFMGKRQQHIHITFSSTTSVKDELYLIANDALEENNLVLDNEELAQNCTALLDAWIEKTGDHPNALYISPANQEALEALGYVQ
jgi:hypothetical protein